MAGGAGQVGAAMLVERVVVFLLESLRGAGGGGAEGLRKLPVVDGAALPRDPGLRREGVAGLRQLPLKPGRGLGGEEGHGVMEGCRGQARRRLPPHTGTLCRLSVPSAPGAPGVVWVALCPTRSGLGQFLSTATRWGTRWGAGEPHPLLQALGAPHRGSGTACGPSLQSMMAALSCSGDVWVTAREGNKKKPKKTPKQQTNLNHPTTGKSL